MPGLRNSIGALGLVFLSAHQASGETLSDLQGRNGVPDNAATNCARQTLLDIAKTWPGQIFQETIQYKGETMHQFILFHGGEQETQVDVVDQGPGYKFTYAAIKGDVNARMQALEAKLTHCVP